jgi:hypothetical protein
MENDTQDVFGFKITLIQQEIAKKGYMFSGEEHQNSLTGMPVFSDGTAFRASMRAWGHIMARTYSSLHNKEYNYMDFYMSLGSDSVLPEYTTISITAKNLDTESCGCTVRADQELIEQSIQFGMELITTDKVIKQTYECIKKQ